MSLDDLIAKYKQVILDNYNGVGGKKLLVAKKDSIEPKPALNLEDRDVINCSEDIQEQIKKADSLTAGL